MSSNDVRGKDEVLTDEDPGVARSIGRRLTPDGLSGMGPMTYLAEERASIVGERPGR